MNRARQRGAIGLSATLLMLSVVLLAAVSIDSARLYLAKRTLQAQADLAALAMSRSSCYIDGVNNEEELKAEALSNLAANGFEGTATIDFATAYISNKHWKLKESAVDRSAGKVLLIETVPASLLAGGVFGEDIRLSASATVLKRLNVGYSMGSGLVDVDLTNSLLSALLGGSVSLLSYEGLLNARINLGELLAALDETGTGFNTDLSLGNLTELLETEVSVGDLLDAMISVLGSDASASAAVTLLQQLRLTGNSDALDVTLANLLSIVDETSIPDDVLGRSLLATNLNAYDLLTSVLMSANQDSVLTLNGLSLSVAGVSNLGVTLKVIQAPQYVVGYFPSDEGAEPVLKTAQLQLGISGSLSLSSLGLPVSLANFTLAVSIANAEAKLLDVQGCTLKEGMDLTFQVSPSTAGVQVNASILGLLGTSVATVSGNVPVASSSPVTKVISVQDADLPYGPERVNSSASSTLSGTIESLNLSVSLLGLTLSTAQGQSVKSLFADTLETLGSALIEPLLLGLGVSIGYADITILSADVEKGDLIQ
ncbi:hypothetical protein WH50_25425 [Pokkaliibacter plantistimulans]|uniref:Flp pilus-assembly TadG-like N-terminal domain-containing protein n=1 Tax=Pokkaliibacter plantistimulans TaxID=1635171 RepID=A0ABX5LV71_9GAMM|nr:hypothetical protein [Pokkaliibacter plantistimulans]PXF28605.1 hypothetical protein WH50_25425 [Pokkaliibacter plantistimulans]